MEKEGVPRESETIAIKRAARLSEKLKRARTGFVENKAWWSNTAVETVILLSLLSLNLYLVSSHFTQAAPDIPYSGPILPLLAKGVEFFGVPLPNAFQYVNIFFFLLFPITFYIFIRSVSERKLIAIMAATIASLPFYPFAEIRANAAFIGGDGSHIASLAATPLALYGLLSFLKNAGVRYFIIASIFSSIVALISPFGFLTYAIFASIAGFSEMLLGKGRLKFFRMVSTFLVSASLSAFWYNPAFALWMITGPMGSDIRLMLTKLIPISFFAIPVLASFGYLLFDRKPNLQPLFLASFFTIAFCLIALAGGGIFPSHPSRYVAELGIALSFFVSIITVKLVDLIRLGDAKKIFWLKLGGINKKHLADGILLALFIVFVSAIFLGKNRLGKKQDRVLGLWSGVARGEIWIAKDRFGGFSRVLGYAITSGSLVGLTFISRFRKPK